MKQIRCSKCGRLYADGRTDCESCGCPYEDKPIMDGQLSYLPTYWAGSTAVVPYAIPIQMDSGQITQGWPAAMARADEVVRTQIEKQTVKAGVGGGAGDGQGSLERLRRAIGL